MDLLYTIIIGGISGWLGAQIWKGGSLGLIGNIVVGILGGFVGSWALGKAGISLGGGTLGLILTSAVGAIIILVLLNLIMSGKKA